MLQSAPDSNPSYFMKIIILLFLLCSGFYHINAQSNYVFTTGEALSFSSISLSTPGTQTWSTDRAALPGYFSATNGTIYSGASDASNINGYVKKYGNEIYTFPVGSGTDLRMLTIDNSAGLITDAYAVAWIAGNPAGNMDPTAPNAGAHPLNSVGAGILTVSPVGQWDWQVGDANNLGAVTTGTGAGIPITVSIPNLTLFATGSALRLVGWNGTQWINLSGNSGASSNVENSTLNGTMIAGITSIAIASTEFILPVKLLNFSVKEERNCMAAAKWSVTEQLDMNRYELEQSSNGINFIKVSETVAKQNNLITDYNSRVAASTGNNYYRLKMIDNNGKFEYSQVQSLRTSCQAANDNLLIYPNLVVGGSNEITVECRQLNNGKGKILVTNNMGQQVHTQSIQLNAGVSNTKINTTTFNAGIYFVHLTDVSGKIIGAPQKFIKQ